MQGLLLQIDYIPGTINLAKFLWLRSSWAQRKSVLPLSPYMNMLSNCFLNVMLSFAKRKTHIWSEC